MGETTAKFWESTYIKCIGTMAGICYRYTSSVQIAHDLAHDAFLKAIEKSETYRGTGAFEGWLRKITINVALEYLREQKKNIKLTAWVKENTKYAELQENDLMEEENDYAESELLDIINQLPDHHKLVFNLYVIDRYSHAEISKVLGISEGTSKSHLSRARKKIREWLAQKSKERQQKNKWAILLFSFSHRLWRPDHLFRRRFSDFELPTKKPVSFEFNESGIVSFNRPTPTFSILRAPLNKSIATVMLGLGLILTPGSQINDSSLRIFSIDIKTPTTTHVDPEISDEITHTGNTSKNNKEKKSSKIESPAATKSPNDIIPYENKSNSISMNKTDLLAATLLLAGNAMALDTNAQVKTTEVGDKTISIHAGGVQSNQNTNVESFPKRDGTDESGTFYGSDIFWSAKNYEVYFEGKSVVHIGKNNFVSNGTANFLGPVKYLVYNGTPLAPNDRIKLTEKKYNLNYLSKASAQAKYGEKGKEGAVEIWLAE